MQKLKRFLIFGITAVLVLSLKGNPIDTINAQDSDSDYSVYFPLWFQAEPVLYDDFSDADPEWFFKQMQNTLTPGVFFRHERGLLYTEVLDNADRYVAWPGWRPQGDFMLEVRARFDRPNDSEEPPFQTRGGLGLIFGASDDMTQHYAYMLGYWGRQPAWALLRYDGKKADGSDIKTNLSSYGGAPGFVKGFDGWNHLSVRRIKDLIYLYCNGHQMPMPEPYYTYVQDGTYGTHRLVGVTVTSWEASYEPIEFDDFKLTPLSMPY